MICTEGITTDIKAWLFFMYYAREILQLMEPKGRHLFMSSILRCQTIVI